MSEPFGYFKAEPFGWTDCGPDDDGAKALYEWPANTRLTDAAPDLLEALQRLEKRGYLSQNDCAGIDGNNDLAFARAAIAKAEGRP